MGDDIYVSQRVKIVTIHALLGMPAKNPKKVHRMSQMEPILMEQ